MENKHETCIEIIHSIKYFQRRIKTLNDLEIPELKEKFKRKREIFNKCIERLEQRHLNIVSQMYFSLNLSTLDLSKVDNVKVGGIDTEDYPDFCDAYVESADYNGVPMTENQLEMLNEQRDFVYESVNKQLF